jgi:hypothetical protein
MQMQGGKQQVSAPAFVFRAGVNEQALITEQPVKQQHQDTLNPAVRPAEAGPVHVGTL